MIRTAAAAVTAVAAGIVSLGYFYVLNDGYAKPTEIAGTLYRFAGSTGTVVLVGFALLIAFPIIVRTPSRRIATATVLLGWILIEVGSMAFSLWYDYQHLDHNIDFWSAIQAPLFIGGYVLMAAGLTLFMVQLKKHDTGWLAASILIGIFGVALALLGALFVRSLLFVVPVAALLAIILMVIPRRRKRLDVAA